MRISDWSSDVCSSDLVGIRIRKSLAEATLEDILELINIDLIAALHLSKLAAAAMLTAKRPGRFITVTSIAGELARPGDAIYPIAKQGLAGMVRTLAVEYGGQGITSNGIAPGRDRQRGVWGERGSRRVDCGGGR